MQKELTRTDADRSIAHVQTQAVQNLVDELEAMEHRVRHRAYEIFQAHGGGMHAFDDWLEAEHELVWKPPIELSEQDGEFIVDVALPGLETRNIDVRVTSDDLLVRGRTEQSHVRDGGTVHVCEMRSGEVFRTVHFPKRIDPDHVSADYRQGLLHVTAAIAKDQGSKRVEIGAA
jgi:HSP20 family molecular chaperone IbpA